MTNEPNLQLVTNPESSVSDWVSEINRSPTLRQALADAEAYVLSLPDGGGRLARDRTMRVFCQVVRSERVAQAIHDGSLTFREVVGLRDMQSKVGGAVRGRIN